ncbi:hypothetical protein CAPTEDRAFT_211198, partial [Capitella teleta]
MKPGVHAAELPLTLREQIDKGPHSSDVTCVDQLQLRRYLDFGGWSKHMPVQKDDKKLQRNRQIRHNINEDNAQHSRDSAGYLTGLSLKPKLPATCSCDIPWTNDQFIVDFNTILFCKHAPQQTRNIPLTLPAGVNFGHLQ